MKIPTVFYDLLLLIILCLMANLAIANFNDYSEEEYKMPQVDLVKKQNEYLVSSAKISIKDGYYYINNEQIDLNVLIENLKTSKIELRVDKNTSFETIGNLVEALNKKFGFAQINFVVKK